MDEQVTIDAQDLVNQLSSNFAVKMAQEIGRAHV